ncbi:MAG TPA: choice-of-anchor tandem repeat GloVer-containing protein, partial [Rhizomicrobium sp.]
MIGRKGVLYGTTTTGGSANDGVVFELAPNGTETVLHNFTGGPTDGMQPNYGSLIRDKAGNLYGTTAGGGTHTLGGTVFKLTPDGTESLLYSFTGGSDGASPAGGVILDSTGNLYGTTFGGGSSAGYGVAYKLAPDGTETVLYSFQGGNDGQYPY